MAEPCLRLIQVTDMHLQDRPEIEMRGVNPEERFLAVMDEVSLQKADMLLLTGDLTHHSKPAYQRLSTYLQHLTFPSYWIPGNHDLTGEMFKFADCGYGRKVVEQGGWRILLLDSSSSPDGRGSGSLSEAELDFLSTELEETAHSQNVLLVLHHNPVSVNSEWQDAIMLANADQFWSIVERYPQVKGVMFGHVHQAWQLERNNLKLFSCPATAAQFKSCTASSETENIPELSGPAYAIYELHENGLITQKVKRLTL
ncbi:MAG: metallophosphoesterase [Neptuniibacter sp.]